MTGRDRPDTQEAMDLIQRARAPRESGPLTFHAFANILLVLVMIMTMVTFAYIFSSERTDREVAERRSLMFELHVEQILDEIQMTQLQNDERQLYNDERHDERRDDRDETLERIEGRLAELLERVGDQTP